MAIIIQDYGTVGVGGAKFSWNELNCYNSPKTFECKNAFFYVAQSLSFTAVVNGKVEDGVLTVVRQSGGTATYSNGVLTLNCTEGSAYGNIFIIYE